MLTVRPVGLEGELVLVDDDGVTAGYGKARASKSVPGYVTLVLTQTLPTARTITVRVPADWLGILARAEPAAEAGDWFAWMGSNGLPSRDHLPAPGLRGLTLCGRRFQPGRVIAEAQRGAWLHPNLRCQHCVEAR